MGDFLTGGEPLTDIPVGSRPHRVSLLHFIGQNDTTACFTHYVY